MQTSPSHNVCFRLGKLRASLATLLVLIATVSGAFVQSVAQDPVAVAKQLNNLVMTLRSQEMGVLDRVFVEVEGKLSNANNKQELDGLLVQLHELQDQEKQKAAELQRAEENNFRQVLIPALREKLQGLRDQLVDAQRANDNNLAQSLNKKIEAVNQELESVHKDGLEAVQKVHKDQRDELITRHEKQRSIIHRLRESLDDGDDVIHTTILEQEAVLAELVGNQSPQELAIGVRLDKSMVPTPKVVHRDFSSYGTGDPLNEI